MSHEVLEASPVIVPAIVASAALPKLVERAGARSAKGEGGSGRPAYRSDENGPVVMLVSITQAPRHNI